MKLLAGSQGGANGQVQNVEGKTQSKNKMTCITIPTNLT